MEQSIPKIIPWVEANTPLAFSCDELKEGLSRAINERVKCSAIDMCRRPATKYGGGIDLDVEGGSPVRMTKSISRCGESNEDPNNRQEHLGPMWVRRLARQSSAS
jgi:hypothetical protein